MAITLQLPDGDFEIILDPLKEFPPIIEKYMGRDARFAFEESLASVAEENETGENYELIADGLRRLALDTLNDLQEALKSPRLDRNTIIRIMLNLSKNL